MPLIRGTGGQSATAERYTATANGPKMRRRCEGCKSYSRIEVLVFVGSLDEINDTRQTPFGSQLMNGRKELL